MSNQNKTYRVSGQEKNSYYVIDSERNVLRAELKGKMRFDESLHPAIGDWVLGAEQPGGWILISETIDRKNALMRDDPSAPRAQIFASNVDYMFVVTSANMDLNESRLERYLAMAAACKIQAVVIVNKIELADDKEKILKDLQERIPVADIHMVSAHANLNKEAFDRFLQEGKTAVFVGSSGVGKSSLVNWILNKEIQVTSEIREDDSKGRHTTTNRSMHFVESGAVLIDTPGIRSLGLYDAAQGVGEVFSDIDEIANSCKFSDCKHESEPGCEINIALESGAIDPDRWQSYLKLAKETRAQAAKIDRKVAQEEKQKQMKMQREFRKIKFEKSRR